MKINKKVVKLLAILWGIPLILGGFISTLAFFTDRTTQAVPFNTASFETQGYSLTRVAPSGPYAAGEDIEVPIIEKNTGIDRDLNTIISMTVQWTSPDPTRTIFGNTNAADNATISIADQNISYTVNDDGTISFDLPTHLLPKGGSEQSRTLIFHIPDSLVSTGSLAFQFDQVRAEQSPSGFDHTYTRTELNATETLDFSVKVGWAASLSEEYNGKTLMGYLTETDTEGEYGIQFVHEYGSESSAMKDFTGKTDAKWSAYKDCTTELTFVEGITTIGDYAFPDFEKITSLDLPESLTAVGTYGFDNISIPSLTLPANLVTYETMSFGHINELTEITFLTEEGETMNFPEAGETTGAFYVDPYVPTKILGPNATAQNYDWVTDQRRVIPIIRSYSYTWEEGAVDEYVEGYVAEQADFHADTYRNTVLNVTFEDANTYYKDEHFAVISAMKSAGTYEDLTGTTLYWEISHYMDYSVIAALDTSTGELTIMADGGKVFANENSDYLFGLFENVDIIDARKYDTRLATSMVGWHTFNDPPAPEPGEPSGEQIVMPMMGASQVLGTETWDMSNVVYISDMFHNAKNLEALEVGPWDTGSLVYANGAFHGCGKLKTLDVSNWDMADVITLQATFARCEGLESLPLENWDVRSLQDMDMTFSNIGLESMDLSNWNTESLDYLSQTFQDAKVKTLNLTGWDTSQVYSLYCTFRGTGNLESLDLSTWDISLVERAYQCFTRSGVKTLDLTGWDFSSCYDIDFLCMDCTSLEDIIGEETWTNTGTWDSFGSVFRNCESLKSVDCGNWDVSGVTGSSYGFNYAFMGCKSLTSLDVANWDVSSSQSFDSMFMNCENISNIDISKWDMSAMTYTSYAADMFNGCRSLTELTFPEAVNYMVSGMAANCPLLEKVTFLSTATELDLVWAAGYTNENNTGALYVTPEDALSRYPDTGKIPTTIVTYGDAMLSLVEGGYEFAVDNRDVGFRLPMLLSNGAWYKGSVSKPTITSITFSDSTVPSSYDESWDASVTNDGAVMGYLVGTDLYLVGNGSGKIYASPDSSYAFGSSWSSLAWSSVTTINGMELLDTSLARDISWMFGGMTNLVSVDVSSFNTEKVTMATNVFYGCSALEHLDFTDWNDSKLTNGYNMFYNCSSLSSMIIGANITNFTEFQPRNLKALTDITFLHGDSDTVTLPTAGSSTGAFYVSSSVSTRVTTNNKLLLGYDWATDKRTVTFTQTVMALIQEEGTVTDYSI